MSDDGVWVGWDIDEDGEPGGYSQNRIGGPRICVASEDWAAYQHAKQLVRRLEGTWAQFALQEQRAWDATHPPPPPSPAMAAIGEMVVKSVDFTRMPSRSATASDAPPATHRGHRLLKFADWVNRTHDAMHTGERIDVRLPERYRPRENA